jgi:hypothetical protein
MPPGSGEVRFLKDMIMLKKTIAAGIVGVAMLAASAPASADNFSFRFSYGAPAYGHGQHLDDRRGDYHRTLSPRQVRRILRDRGFRNINYVDRRGSIYQVHATNRNGRRVGLVVSARSGDIINRYRL